MTRTCTSPSRACLDQSINQQSWVTRVWGAVCSTAECWGRSHSGDRPETKQQLSGTGESAQMLITSLFPHHSTKVNTLLWFLKDNIRTESLNAIFRYSCYIFILFYFLNSLHAQRGARIHDLQVKGCTALPTTPARCPHAYSFRLFKKLSFVKKTKINSFNFNWFSKKFLNRKHT